MTEGTQTRDAPRRIEEIREVVRHFADNSHAAITPFQMHEDKESAYRFIELQVDDEDTRQELRDFYNTHAVKG